MTKYLLPIALLSLSHAACTLEYADDSDPALHQHMQKSVTVDDTSSEAAQAWLEKHGDSAVEWSYGDAVPADAVVTQLVECPERINLPSSAPGWTGLPYVPKVNKAQSLCIPGFCHLSCQFMNGGIVFEVYRSQSFDFCIPAISPTGLHYFDCGFN